MGGSTSRNSAMYVFVFPWKIYNKKDKHINWVTYRPYFDRNWIWLYNVGSGFNTHARWIKLIWNLHNLYSILYLFAKWFFCRLWSQFALPFGCILEYVSLEFIIIFNVLLQAYQFSSLYNFSLFLSVFYQIELIITSFIV